MAELPPEMIVKILSKLPIKSLLRFQCVSKSWQSLIYSHDFAKTHLNQTLISDSTDHRYLLVSVHHSSLHTSELNLFNNQLSLSFSELRNHPLERRQRFNLVGSCNGVVCVSNLNKTDVVLFNPFTNSHRKLPCNDVSIPHFDKTVVIGFGYDRENEDYKVLRISQGPGNIDDSKDKVEVYSLKSNSWKCMKGIQYYIYYWYYHGVLVNEGLHYLVIKELYSESLSIAKFDLGNDSISLMDCPNDGNFDIKSGDSEFILTEFDGCLCLLINSFTFDFDIDLDVGFDGPILDHVDLWVMKEYGNELSWVKLFSIRHPGHIGSYKFIRTVVWSKDGRRILLEIDHSGYCWYDLESKNVERVIAHGLPDGDILSGAFVGSLVSVGDSEKEALLKKDKKKDVDKLLSAGFKLKL